MVAVCMNGKVWSAADAKKLREEHRFVCGNGSICRENSNKAPADRIPLQLTPEQLYVGQRHGFLTQTSLNSQQESPTPSNEWWRSTWNMIASFFRQTTHTDEGPQKRRRIDPQVEQHRMEDTPVPLRHRIFLDLWEKGFYITSGSKFGGDYLLYDVDPLTSHAKAIVVVSECPVLSASELAGFSRLARAVKKTFVMAYVNDNQTVSYTTLVHVATTTRTTSGPRPV
ncbi:tRNA-splicing endonuclease subunit Sen34 [Aphanomyces cochlioides]|nr:tRNA-splicing endonuclease subunit Sen34 [Aphanomyces cochlioides]